MEFSDILIWWRRNSLSDCRKKFRLLWHQFCYKYRTFPSDFNKIMNLINTCIESRTCQISNLHPSRLLFVILSQCAKFYLKITFFRAEYNSSWLSKWLCIQYCTYLREYCVYLCQYCVREYLCFPLSVLCLPSWAPCFHSSELFCTGKKFDNANVTVRPGITSMDSSMFNGFFYSVPFWIFRKSKIKALNTSLSYSCRPAGLPLSNLSDQWSVSACKAFHDANPIFNPILHSPLPNQ